MAGILDSKERVMDFIITQEGKLQAGTGELRVKFASFTDYHTFYETSGSAEIPTLADDATNRIFFEAYSRYQDMIVPELTAGSSLRPFRAGDFSVVGGNIASGTFRTGMITQLDFILSGNDLPSMTPLVMDGITKNFNEQRIIGSIDEFSFSNDFVMSPNTVNFSIDKNTEYFRHDDSSASDAVSLENIPSLFSDRRFSRFSNFMYLPPQNVPLPGEITGSQLSNYVNLNEKSKETLDELMSTLTGKQVSEVYFSTTSRSNNIVCQLFESDISGVDKLSIVEFGAFDDANPTSPDSLLSPGRRVFFAGKLTRDSTGAETFLCIFTIIID